MSMDNVTKRIILTPFNLLYRVSPRKTLELLFFLKQGRPLNLDNPKTFNEKLQWIKLYDKNPLMPKCCDKYTVRSYVEEKGCGEYLNTLIWQGFEPEQIPFDSLPQRFVIKVTHGSTFNIICTDKDSLDRKTVVRQCRRWLREKFLPCYGEWFYGIERPRVIVEEYLEDREYGQLFDYKVFCFNGRARIIAVYSDRATSCRQDIYDTSWNKMIGMASGYPNSDKTIAKPRCLPDMLRVAETLSRDFLHARVDFYVVNGALKFGEITFTTGAGFERFVNPKLDAMLGDWLELPLGDGLDD